VVGEAEDDVAGLCQERLALGVGFVLARVDVAVELDDEAAIGAAEIGDEGADGVLAAELQA
jgi:hypothetical protein